MSLRQLGRCDDALRPTYPAAVDALHARARDLLVSMLREIAEHQPPDRDRLAHIAAQADPAAVGWLLGIIDASDARRGVTVEPR